ncbi:MAG: hypothetical protein A3D94_18885 [Alphaproteobacteria bacterium RIFCSPHIGHO2_12_FULL_66_14]|jgi:hypothetical protein|nr:MAG: hypothetical protein A3D94_18885 [Alphaproteobacteria bacterium RIFCSPHIGHO2_12_FULL_66_14]
MIKVLVALVVMAVVAPVAAQPLDLDAIARQPGTQVTRRGDAVEIKRGDVTVTIDKDGETGVDSSGHAVLCIWNIAIVAKISADLCYPGEFPQLSAMLGQFIDAANTFIATNSLRPVTKAQLEKNIADRTAKAAAGIKAAGVPPAQNRVCQRQREDDLVPLNAELEKYRREFQDTLKVPRPPVENPCG